MRKMSSPYWVVLLACGSYNPITNMHLRMFELARDYLHSTGRFKVVGGIISPVNDGYKKSGLIAAKHRCSMVNLALQSSDWIKLDTWESDQDTWVETVKVLEHHQAKLNSRDANDNSISFRKRQRLDFENANVNSVNNQSCFCNDDNPIQVKLLCGADLLESFGNSNVWKESDVIEIVEKYGLVIITREGTNPHRFIYESDILSKYQRNIHIVTEWITNEISSTRIRRALRRGESVKYLIQDDIIKYIQEHNLYKTSDKSSTVEVMAISRWSCLNHPDIFCYICGEYTLKASRKPISEFVKRAYVGYFGINLEDQAKPVGSSYCMQNLYGAHLCQWTNGKKAA